MSRGDWQEVAGALQDLAERAQLLADDLADELPEPTLRLYIRPAGIGSDDGQVIAAVNLVAEALLGVPAATVYNGVTTEHKAKGRIGVVQVMVRGDISSSVADLAAENARLRAQLAEREQTGGAS